MRDLDDWGIELLEQLERRTLRVAGMGRITTEEAEGIVSSVRELKNKLRATNRKVTPIRGT